MKVCTKCKQKKNYSDFGVSKKMKDGLNIYCRECVRKASQEYRDANPEQNRISQRKYAEKNREHISKKQLERYYADRERFKKQAAEYRLANYKRRLEIEKTSRNKNKEKWRSSKNARQSIRNRLLDGNKFIILDKELNKLYNQSCIMCGNTKKISIDHIIPLSRGGNHSIGNLQPLCTPCNSSKGSKLLVEWKYAKIMDKEK